MRPGLNKRREIEEGLEELSDSAMMRAIDEAAGHWLDDDGDESLRRENRAIYNTVRQRVFNRLTSGYRHLL